MFLSTRKTVSDQDQQKISMNVCPECVFRCKHLSFAWACLFLIFLDSLCHLNVQWSTAYCPPFGELFDSFLMLLSSEKKLWPGLQFGQTTLWLFDQNLSPLDVYLIPAQAIIVSTEMHPFVLAMHEAVCGNSPRRSINLYQGYKRWIWGWECKRRKPTPS